VALALLYARPSTLLPRRTLTFCGAADMNLPICGVAMLVVFLFLQLKTPRESFRAKIVKLDWMCVPRSSSRPCA
jgi:hypothetical protein